MTLDTAAQGACAEHVAPSTGAQMLALSGLRLYSPLGILPREKIAPQLIGVDAEMNLGQQPILPKTDDIAEVLDYRALRNIIIEECTSDHVHLLETLVGKLSSRLLATPGVLGVRLKVAKLTIFDDCEVSVRMEVGSW